MTETEDTENLNIPMSMKETKFVIKNLVTKESPVPNGFAC